MDKKSILAFLIGGGLVGGLVWMVSRPQPEAPPAEVVAQVKAVRTESAAAAASARPSEENLPISHVASARHQAQPQVAASKSPKPSSKPTPAVVDTPAAEPVHPPPPVQVADSRPAPVFIPPTPSRASRADDQPAPAAAPAKKREPNKVTIPAGTEISVHLADKLSTATNLPGDAFQATLDKPIIVDGLVIAEKGARVDGKVASLERAGRVKGVAEIHLELTAMRTSDGQNIRITSDSFVKEGDTSKKQDAEKVGVGAALGAAIGAIAGGGKGAAVGAGAGTAAGAGTVAATRGKDAVLPVETKMTFHLGAAVTVVEKLD